MSDDNQTTEEIYENPTPEEVEDAIQDNRDDAEDLEDTVEE